MKERYVEAMYNEFQVLGGLGSVEYGAGCEVLWVVIMQVLGFAP